MGHQPVTVDDSAARHLPSASPKTPTPPSNPWKRSPRGWFFLAGLWEAKSLTLSHPQVWYRLGGKRSNSKYGGNLLKDFGDGATGGINIKKTLCF